MAENSNADKAISKERIKSKKSREDILEIIVAIFLGVTALATAWASWIGSLHGGIRQQITHKVIIWRLTATQDGTRRHKALCRI